MKYKGYISMPIGSPCKMCFYLLLILLWTMLLLKVFESPVLVEGCRRGAGKYTIRQLEMSTSWAEMQITCLVGRNNWWQWETSGKVSLKEKVLELGLIPSGSIRKKALLNEWAEFCTKAWMYRAHSGKWVKSDRPRKIKTLAPYWEGLGWISELWIYAKGEEFRWCN